MYSNKNKKTETFDLFSQMQYLTDKGKQEHWSIEFTNCQNRLNTQGRLRKLDTGEMHQNGVGNTRSEPGDRDRKFDMQRHREVVSK